MPSIDNRSLFLRRDYGVDPPISNKYFYSQINKSMNKEHEPLLNTNPKRFVLFPIQHDDVRCSTCVCVSIVIL